MSKPRSVYHLYFLMAVSLFSITITAIMIVNKPIIHEDYHWRRAITGLLFSSMCLMGLLAVLFPSECSGLFYLEKKRDDAERARGLSESMLRVRTVDDTTLILGVEITHGHHPHCDNFSTHEFRLRGKTFCAGCTGLLIGVIISIIAAILYFLIGWDLAIGSVPTAITGLICIGFALIQSPILKIKGLIRIIPNALQVVGSFLLLASFDSLVRSIGVNLFIIMLSVFWVWTRISLSKWDHLRTCKACGYKCLE